jgi:hypothetical protein
MIISQDKKFINERELALRWAISVKALHAWRQQRKGLAWAKLGNSVRYDLEVVEAYERDQQVQL